MNLLKKGRQRFSFRFLSSFIHYSCLTFHAPFLIFRLLLIAVVLALLLLPAALTHAQQGTLPDQIIKKVSFEQKLNQQLPLNVTFRNETGQLIQLSQYFGQKPVILVFAYYECPMLCTLVLNGLLDTLQNLTFDLGKQFEVITVSIDPTETPELATAKKKTYIDFYGRPGAAEGWHFLTGDETNIRRLTDAAGFHYQYDAERHEYAHPTGIMILTPQGKIARYLYGIKYPDTDVRLGLIEASQNKIGSPVDQVLLTCYHYDPVAGKYDLAIMNVIRLAGFATVSLLGVVIVVMLRHDRGTKSRQVALEEPKLDKQGGADG